MQDLRPKAEAIAKIVFVLTGLLLLVFSVDYVLIKVVMSSLAVFTYVLLFVAIKKKGPWELVFWIWSVFFLPLFSAEMLIMGFLGRFFSVEAITVWGIPVYLSVLPLILWFLMTSFKRVFAEMY